MKDGLLMSDWIWHWSTLDFDDLGVVRSGELKVLFSVESAVVIAVGRTPHMVGRGCLAG